MNYYTNGRHYQFQAWKLLLIVHLCSHVLIHVIKNILSLLNIYTDTWALWPYRVVRAWMLG